MNVWFIHATECYLAMKKIELPCYAKTWTNLKSLNGKANLKEYLLYDFTYMTFLKKSYRNNKSVVAGDLEQWVGLVGDRIE